MCSYRWPDIEAEVRHAMPRGSTSPAAHPSFGIRQSAASQAGIGENSLNQGRLPESGPPTVRARRAVASAAERGGRPRESAGGGAGRMPRGREPRAGARRAGAPGARGGRGSAARGIRYLTLPAVRPPTRRFSMIMKSTTTGMIATIETPNT